ncbi:TetR/AcrR family transcriptional regulator [Alkalihalobacillus sp. BA299]|uniref:TetR/AcrR family transcriptional regulator n=1 Tax=Alkalihalobacillus sp. BA299 TaxID=2815938 RepID=UPI001ADAE41B|nr:TetR/AcrR family transcriptional regulator [Alkalihalobacillus sp. BA299]
MSPRVGLDTETIVIIAAEMADAKGIEAVTLASLAKKLQVRSPSLYNHIASLEELKKKIAIYGLEQLFDKLAEAARDKTGDDAVRSLAIAYVAFVRAHPGLYETTLQAPDANDPELQYAGSKIVKLAVDVLSAYNLSKEASLHAVRGLRSILHGFASLEQKGGFGLPLDVNVSFTLLIDAFLRGLYTINQLQVSSARGRFGPSNVSKSQDTNCWPSSACRR